MFESSDSYSLKSSLMTSQSNCTNLFNDSSISFFLNCKFPPCINCEEKKVTHPNFQNPFLLFNLFLLPLFSLLLFYNHLSFPHNRAGALNPKNRPPAPLSFPLRTAKNARHPTLIPLPSIRLERPSLIIYHALKFSFNHYQS